MYYVLDKDMKELVIVPYLPKTKRGFALNVSLVEIVNAILYKLKTTVQWHLLLVPSLFEYSILSWQSVYYHYGKWCLSSVWQGYWISLLRDNKSKLDLSSVDLDGSYTPAIRSGQAVEYPGRKKRKTTNSLYITDRQGLPFAMSEPVAGNHNDLHNIVVQFEVVITTLQQADISIDGLFLNTDTGFDSKDFRICCYLKEIIPIFALTNVMEISNGMNILTESFI